MCSKYFTKEHQCEYFVQKRLTTSYIFLASTKLKSYLTKEFQISLSEWRSILGKTGRELPPNAYQVRWLITKIEPHTITCKLVKMRKNLKMNNCLMLLKTIFWLRCIGKLLHWNLKEIRQTVYHLEARNYIKAYLSMTNKRNQYIFFVSFNNYSIHHSHGSSYNLQNITH